MLNYVTIPVTAMFAGLLAAALWAILWTTALNDVWIGHGVATVPVFLTVCVGSAVCMRKLRR